MRLLVLGGTGFLSGAIATQALHDGDDVTCLVRGTTSVPPAGATFVRADRDDPAAYDDVARADWDAVVEISSDPRRIRAAATALAPRTRHIAYISSASVYVDDATPDQDESAAIHEPTEDGAASDPELYGAHKVACERIALAEFGNGTTTIFRAGLIGGPGDRSDRTGYWPLRFARPADERGRVLIPDAPDLATQVIDARDLATFVLHCVRARIAGTFNALGDSIDLAQHLAVAQRVAGFRGTTVAADPEWLTARDVEPWMGPRSLPLWLPLPEYAGFGTRDGSAARSAGLRIRSLEETLADVLVWERTRDIAVRRAGLTGDDERQLLQELEG
jgi:nucleoside-diphosphate-sugar epimerase